MGCATDCPLAGHPLPHRTQPIVATPQPDPYVGHGRAMLRFPPFGRFDRSRRSGQPRSDGCAGRTSRERLSAATDRGSRRTRLAKHRLSRLFARDAGPRLPGRGRVRRSAAVEPNVRPDTACDEGQTLNEPGSASESSSTPWPERFCRWRMTSPRPCERRGNSLGWKSERVVPTLSGERPRLAGECRLERQMTAGESWPRDRAVFRPAGALEEEVTSSSARSSAGPRMRA